MNVLKYFLLFFIPLVEFFNPDRIRTNKIFSIDWRKLKISDFLGHRYLTNYALGTSWILFVRFFGKSIYDLYNQVHLLYFHTISFRTLNIMSGFFFFLFFDYITYLWHRANHQFSLLRRFHQVHHSDLEVDASTTFRFHFVELFLQLCFKITFAFIFKIHLVYLFLFESFLLIFGYCHHGNIYLPRKLTLVISWILVTPRFHFNHHLLNLNYANSNYGSIFTFWDRLHGTYTVPVFEDNVELGIKEKRTPVELTLRSLLKMPFNL